MRAWPRALRARLIHTSLAPSVSRRDAALALRSLLRPSAWQRGFSRERLERELGIRLAGAPVLAVDSGRHALQLALQGGTIGPGDEVLLQAYTCVSVPGPVLWVGARPVYVDIRPETLTMDPEDLLGKITPRARALIIQHTFGLPADLEPLLRLAREHHLFVIEDCAHALGATYHGRPVGTFGDAAIFSFGRDKVISSVFGGALAVRDRAVGLRVSERVRRLTAPPSCWIVQQLLHPLVMPALRSTYWAGGNMALRLLQAAHLLSKALTRDEKSGGPPPLPISPLPNALAQLARFQLQRLEAFTHHRRLLAQHYTESLRDLPRIRLPVIPADRTHAFLRYAIRVSDPAALHAAARSAGIVLGDWYDTVVAPKGTDVRAVRYATGSCPRAEEAARHSVNLPTSPTLSLPDADRVLRAVRRS